MSAAELASKASRTEPADECAVPANERMNERLAQNLRLESGFLVVMDHICTIFDPSLLRRSVVFCIIFASSVPSFFHERHLAFIPI